jgi:uncharacterized repeat protein (TIGR03847 family)
VPRHVHRFDLPDRFVAGTVGAPGERTFYLQAQAGPLVTSVLVEKEQVAELATRLDDMLDRLMRRSAGEAPVPAVTPAAMTDVEPLALPLVEEFRVGSIALAWDDTTQRVLVEAHAVADEDTGPPAFGDEESDTGPDVLVVRLTGAMARAFASRTSALVSAGRPPCPLCGNPLDPAGHICPRQNGKLR